jgi:two-component system response regulator AlgR
MRVLIADDEAPARSRLRSLLQEVAPGVELVGEVGDGGAAFQLAAERQPEVALLDIRMPGTDGIQAALRMAQLARPPAIIFVSAYDEYALAAFDANAIDYLLKPVRAARLRSALEKAVVFTQAQREALRETLPALHVTQAGGLRRIPLDEIICLRADSKYVEVCHEGGIALSDSSLKAIEEKYPGRFLRVRRNALVDPSRARALHKAGDGFVLEVEGMERALEVGRRHLPSVRRLLKS